jgi:deoxyribodipyrimidine photo-lyase
MPVEPERIKALNDAPIRPKRKYVLYWMQMNRRVRSNQALQRAIELANQHHIPVIVYEGLTCTYECANDRIHTFMLEAVPDNGAALRDLGIGYVFYLRRTAQDANNTFYQLASNAAAVITDDYPTFIAREHNSRVPAKLDIAMEAIDASCVVPMRAMPGRQYAAYTMRPKINAALPRFLKAVPQAKPVVRYTGTAPSFHTEVTHENIPALVASCAIDHSVKPSLSFTGGYTRARKLLDDFIKHNLERFDSERNEPSKHATSHMSPYLHFGQISSMEIALAVQKAAEKKSLDAKPYLEELITRRELSFNYACHVDDPGDLANLPSWCQQTMEKHKRDKRPVSYQYEQFERAETYDALWNATQKEMVLRGKIQGYYRMYWGKKIIEWATDYEAAAKTMIDIHTRFALDGRDPNTYTNILWCFGLHDRPWTERPIFGKLRYMSLEGMKRKTDVRAYIDEIAEMESSGRDPVKTV